MLHSLHTPDIRLLRVFMTVVECGGFSAAQIALNVGQSTISTQMSDLESRLGMRLCRRGRSGFALTEDGKFVYESAKSLFRSIDQFTSAVNGARGGLSGELRIAFADVLYRNPDFRLAQAIAVFLERGADVRFDLSTANPLDIEHGVLGERYHLGIHTYPSHVPGLRYYPAFTEEQTLYCGRKHPLFERVGKGRLSLDDIQQFDYVQRSYYGGALSTGPFKPANIAASADNMEALLVLLMSGHYIGHLPTAWANEYVAQGELAPILAKKSRYYTLFEVAVRVGGPQSMLIETFLSDLRDLLPGGGSHKSLAKAG